MTPLLLALALTLIQQIEQAVVVGPGSFEEPCLSLAMGQRLEFEFLAAADLDFNMHYHADSGVEFPLDMKAVRSKVGVYIAPRTRDYCLMWTNHSQLDVQLEYKYRIYQAEPAS
jgi:hypothetical protein